MRERNSKKMTSRRRGVCMGHGTGPGPFPLLHSKGEVWDPFDPNNYAKLLRASQFPGFVIKIPRSGTISLGAV